MPQLVEEVMTPNPVCVTAGDTLYDVARCMKQENIGPVIVTQDHTVCGIVTDRDIVVRTIAEGKDPKLTKVGDICSKEITTIEKGEPIEEAVLLMRRNAIRRLPVVDDEKPIGIVSIGDLAQDRDPESALAEISTAPPNK
ncbi:MAG: CBS domain-containing protein [Actinomycetota bacterium]